MIHNENILCVSNTTWDGPYTKSTIQLLSRLASQNKILFIEYPYTLKDVWTAAIGKNDKPYLRILGIQKRLNTLNINQSLIYTWVAPPTIPSELTRNKRVLNLINKINGFIYRISVQKALRKLQMQNVININAYNPVIGANLIGKIKEKSNIYYCYDGINSNRTFNKALSDERLSRLADGVIVSSEYLNKQKSQFNSWVVTVKNGVDFELFNKYAKTNPNESKKKRIGYIGSIDQRFDIEKVEFAIQNLPNYEFEFIGDPRNKEVLNRLSKYKNVSFLVPVPPHKVPELIAKCDVGIIPYIENEINKNVYPLKVNEYLAVGTPVTMTRFADLPEFNDYVSFANTKEEFLQSIIKEINNDNSTLIQKRINFARQNSWDIRVELFSDAIRSFSNKNQKS